jgi:hypothetical protein
LTTTVVDAAGADAAERAAMQAKIKRVNEIAEREWDNPQWRREMAQQLTQTVFLGFEHENLLGLMTQVENVDFNGRSFIKEARGLRAFWVSRGGYIEASEIREDVLELPRNTIGFHVYEFEDKLRTDFAETQATLVELGIQRLDAEVNLRFLRLIQAAVPNTSPYYLQGNGVDLDALNTALTEVYDETRDGEVIILGRRTMVDQIMNKLTAGPNAGFLPESNEAFLRRGMIATYRGARIMTLKNFRDDMDIPFFPANELFVIARDASKFAFWGGMLSKEYTEDDAWYWHYLARRDFGGVVHRPNRLRRIVDNTIAPYTVVEQ